MKEISIREFQRDFKACESQECVVTRRGKVIGRWIPSCQTSDSLSDKEEVMSDKLSDKKNKIAKLKERVKKTEERFKPMFKDNKINKQF